MQKESHNTKLTEIRNIFRRQYLYEEFARLVQILLNYLKIAQITLKNKKA